MQPRSERQKILWAVFLSLLLHLVVGVSIASFGDKLQPSLPEDEKPMELKNRQHSLDREGAQAQPVSRPPPAPSITQATPQPTPAPSLSATPSPTPQPTPTLTPTPT